MFCTHCGKKNPPQANFCFNCGTTLPVVAASPELTASGAASASPAPSVASHVSSVGQGTEPANGKQCPSCGLWSPGHADRCDCGYDFRRGVLVSTVPVANIKGIGWYLEPWKKYAVFRGRARRKEYWYFMLFNSAAMFAISFIGSLMAQDYSALVGIYYLAMLIPGIAVGVRRMHDSDHSGWWLLCPFVNIAFALTDGTPSENRFGPDPKGRGSQSGIVGRRTSPVAIVAVLIAASVVVSLVSLLPSPSRVC
jgi:uncharacterized membrane protein YhaH (DUF805 family)